MKIKELTPEQEALLPKQSEKWTAIGFCTDPIDFEEAKAAVCEAYECANLMPPKEFEYFRSPYEMYSTFKRRGLKSVKIGYGPVELPRAAFYDTFIQFGINIPKFNGLLKVVQTCGQWEPFENYCAIQDRPCEIHLEEGRLHNEHGPAILYRDGFCVWNIHGVRVNEQIVMSPETQTLDDINFEQSEEIKSIRIERYGWDRYLSEADARLVHDRENPIEYTHEALYDIGLNFRVLVCVCPSTGKLFALEVPLEIESCEAAQSFLSGGRSNRIISAA